MSERLPASRAPAHVPASAANSASFLDTPAQAAANVTDQMEDALSVILVTAGYDHTIRFWEAWSGVCSHTIQHPDSQVNRLAISPDKKLLAAACYNTVRLYDCNPSGASLATAAAQNTDANGRGSRVNPVTTFEGHSGNITSIAWHCDGKWLVSGSEDGTLKIWDTRYVLSLTQYIAPAACIRPPGARERRGDPSEPG